MAVFFVTYCLSGGHAFTPTVEGVSVGDVEGRVSEELRTSSEKWLSFDESPSDEETSARFRIQVSEVIAFKVECKQES